MKTKFIPFNVKLVRPDTTIVLTDKQAFSLFTAQELINGEARFSIKTVGQYQIPVSAFGIVIESKDEKRGKHFSAFPEFYTIHGKRTMTNWVQSGYDAFGTVSINGKKRKCFTSSHLFMVDGKLLNSAVLYLCNQK